MVAQQVTGSAVREVFQRVRRLAADDAAQDGVRILCGQRVLALHLSGKAVGRAGLRAAVGGPDARRIQQADGPDRFAQRHKGALGGGVVVGRDEDIEPAVAEAGFHAVLPALVGHVQQLTEDLCVRRHAPALQLGVDGIADSGGGIAVGVDPLAARNRVQLSALFFLRAGQVGGVLPRGKILLFQRLFEPVQRFGQRGQLFRGQSDRPERLFDPEATAGQHRQQVRDGIRRLFQRRHLPGGGIQCGLPAGQFLGHGVQRTALAAGRSCPMGGQIGPAGLGLGILGRFIGSVPLGQLAASGVEMPLPDGVFSGVGLGAGQQSRAPVDQGVRLSGCGFPAVFHDLFQRGGAGLRLGQHGVEVFQLHPVALQRVQIQFRLGQDVLIQKFPEVRDLVHAGAHLEHLIELFAQRAGRAADAQRTADAVPRLAGAAGIGEPAHGGLEILSGAGGPGARVEEGQLFQRDAVLGDVPGLVAGVELLHGALGLDAHRDDEGRPLDAVPELGTDIGHRPAGATVGVLAALLGVDGTLQGAAALFIAQGIEIAVGGQAVADGVQNGGLAHGVDADHIGQAGTVEGDVLKVVPVDEFQSF